MKIALEKTLAKIIPIDEIKATIQAHMQWITSQLPDKRLKRVLEEMVLGILGGETPVITAIARQNSKDDGESWAVAKRMVRYMENKQVETRQLYEGLYQVGCEAVAREKLSIWWQPWTQSTLRNRMSKASKGSALCTSRPHPIYPGMPVWRMAIQPSPRQW